MKFLSTEKSPDPLECIEDTEVSTFVRRHSSSSHIIITANNYLSPVSLKKNTNAVHFSGTCMYLFSGEALELRTTDEGQSL